MVKHDVAFWLTGLFLIGVLLASAGWGILSSVLVALLIGAAFITFGIIRGHTRFFWFAGLSLFIIAGSAYYSWRDVQFRNVVIPFGEKTEVRGLVIGKPEIGEKDQEFPLKLESPERGKLLVRAGRYETISYGDRVAVYGFVERPFTESYGKYLAKEGISGVVAFPKIAVLSNGNGRSEEHTS